LFLSSDQNLIPHPAVLASHGNGVLGGQHHAFAIESRKISEKRLACAVGVNVCGINEVAARLALGLVDRPRFILAGTPAPTVTKGHRAQ
jgi:hypothetical protein